MGGSSGFYVTKTQAVLIVLLFLVVAVGIGLMAGLIPDRGDDEIILIPQPVDDDPRPPGDQDTRDGPWLDLRLPSYIVPVHYTLWFHPDFYRDGTTYTGREDIEIDVRQATRYLLVHYKQMEISVTELTDAQGTVIDIVQTFPYELHEFWVIETATPLAANTKVFLHLEFSGSLVNGIVGYYKSTYVNGDTGIESWLATTKFQPTDARKAFPCFDEPGIKAQYTVSLYHWQNFTALSNTPIDQAIRDGEEWVTTTFGRTISMSSYLVCFIVTDFVYVENTIEPNGIPSRIYASPDKIDQAAYALETTKTILEFFQDEFDYEFPLLKLDQVAVPDYPTGATEHWGVMTYREVYLLYDPEQVSASGKQRTATIISHEIAHNLFGNEVTCAWWNEIWLNEGFAVFYEHAGSAAAEPDWQMEDHFAITTQQGVMRTDAGANSRSVVVEVETPQQINAAFDGITYDKGASMLRMIESFMGASYTEGIKRYLTNNMRDTAVTDDLWEAFQEVADEDGVDLGGETFADIMNPWVHQMGLPVITIVADAGELTLTPTRFMNNEDIDPTQPPSNYSYEWSIPLTYTTSSGVSGISWIHGADSVTIPDPREPTDEWIKFNTAQMGFYRVNYPADEWTVIDGVLSDNLDDFEPVDRSNLLDDAFNLARAGVLDYDIALDVSDYLSAERHLFPWRSAKAGLDYIGTMIYGEPAYLRWRKYMRDISSPVMDDLGFTQNPTEHLDELLRIDIIEISCNHGYITCQNEMSRLFATWIVDEGADISPNLRPQVYEFGIKFSQVPTEWETMRDRYLASQSTQDQSYMLIAMAQAQEMFLVESYLDFIEDSNNVRDQNFVTAVDHMVDNPIGYLYTWNWIKTKYEELEERFGIDDRTFARMVPNFVMNFNTEYLYEDVERFYARYPEAGAGELARQQSLDSINANVAWLQKNLETIEQWLEPETT